MTIATPRKNVKDFILFHKQKNKAKKTLKTLFIEDCCSAHDNMAVSEFSHLPESWRFLYYFIIALASQTWTSAGHGIVFFQKVWV